MSEQERLKNYKWDKSDWIVIPDGAGFYEIVYHLWNAKYNEIYNKETKPISQRIKRKVRSKNKTKP